MIVGAHVSTSGGLSTAIGRATAIGAQSLQVHLTAPQQWRLPSHAEGEVASFCELAGKAGLAPNFAHAPYLINLASADQVIRERSTRSLMATVEWAGRCNLAGAIVHMGSGRGEPVEEAERRFARALEEVLAHGDGVPIVLENSAGSGDCLGARLEQIGRVIRAVGGDPRLRLCLDTAHAWGSGYDLRDRAGVADLLGEIDEHLGLERLALIHANDSRVALGSAVDRHENLGQGQIGEAGFALLVEQEPLRQVPWILEVPGFDRNGPDLENVNWLRRLGGLPPVAS